LEVVVAVSRRQFLTLASAGVSSVLLADPLKNLYSRAAEVSNLQTKGFGPLVKDPQGLMDLPAGFQYRVFSRTGDRMADGTTVPGSHDGMAAFAGSDGATILVRNHELSPDSTTSLTAPAAKQYDSLCKGGTTTLVISKDRQLLKDYVSLAGTYRNCAGGITPWGSWISCEEATATPKDNQSQNPRNVSRPHGYAFEVPIQSGSPVDPIPMKEMGRFRREAIAIDPRTGIVYQTEDQGDGRFYRFIPKEPGKLAAGGTLEALVIKGQPKAATNTQFPVGQPFAVEWVRMEDPDPVEDTLRGEAFSKGAALFTRGEGIDYSNGAIWFTCTNGGDQRYGQIWRYIPGKIPADGGSIELFVESKDSKVLNFPDNLVMAPFGDLIICEDALESVNRLIGITPKGELYPLARNALNGSELAGACFSPDGQTLFVNIYDPGMTLAIWGPWVKV
jgi:uncharacterized protein